MLKANDKKAHKVHCLARHDWFLIERPLAGLFIEESDKSGRGGGGLQTDCS